MQIIYQVDSDNTLDNWLNQILTRDDKAPKLDFKNAEVIEPSLSLLLGKEPLVNCPVWANGDIVRGPGGLPPSIDSDRYMKTAYCGAPRPELTKYLTVTKVLLTSGS